MTGRLHRLLLATAALLVFIPAHAEMVWPTYPEPQISNPTEAKIIERGEYLVKMGDCIACHTNSEKGGKPFAGGLPFKTPFGSLYSSNITPDKEVGIGSWTDQDFIQAMRYGIRPDGTNNYPVFPYVYFNRLSDDDILAIKAYIFSIPAVNQKPPANEMMFPFNWRFLQGGWKALFFNFHRDQFKFDSTQSEQWNRGKWIVDGLGHCGMCHTPLNPFGAEITEKYLGGGFVDGYYAPNITSANLGERSVAEIVKVFSQDKMFDNAGKVGGPMAEVNHDSLVYLPESDLEAIAVYLKTVPPVVEKAVVASSGADAGKSIYENKCAICHNTGAAGAPMVGNPADWEARIKLGTDTLVQNAIHGINSMPPKGTCMACTDDQIKEAVLYMVDSSGPGSTSATKAVSYAPPLVDTSAKVGEPIYKAKCAVCHDSGADGAPKIGDVSAWSGLLTEGMDVLYFRSVNGYEKMPAMGGCEECTRAEIQAAVKYILQNTLPNKDFSMW